MHYISVSIITYLELLLDQLSSVTVTLQSTLLLQIPVLRFGTSQMFHYNLNV